MRYFLLFVLIVLCGGYVCFHAFSQEVNTLSLKVGPSVRDVSRDVGSGLFLMGVNTPLLGVVPPVTETGTEKKEITATSSVPVTRSVLALMPESAVMALAIPPLPMVVKKGMELLEKIDSGEEPIARVNSFLQMVAPTFGLLDIRSLAGLLLSKGFDPDSSCGLFVDLSQTAVDAAETSQLCAALCTGEKTHRFMPYHPPSVLAVVGVTNSDRAETSASELLTKLFPGCQMGLRKDKINDVNVHWLRDDLVYCVRGPWLFVTNSRTLLAAVLGRVEHPASVWYGSDSCPALDAGEVVLVTDTNRLVSGIPDLAPVRRYIAPTLKEFASWQGRLLKETYAFHKSDAPLVTTFSLNAERMEVTSRFRPVNSEVKGSYPPFRLGAYIEEDGLLSGMIRWQGRVCSLMDTYLDMTPPAGRDNAFMDMRDAIRFFMRDEMTIHIGNGPHPTVHLLMIAKDAERAREWLATKGVPVEDDGEPVRSNVRRYDVLGMEFYGGMEKDVLILTTDKTDFTSLYTSVQSGGGKSWVDDLGLSLDMGTVSWMYSLNPRHREALDSFLNTFGGITDGDVAACLARVLGEVRVVKTVCDGEQKISLSLLFQ